MTPPSAWIERRPLLVAHRGGAREAPENTLHAFRHAVACGAQMVELDLHATRDGEIVVIHDRSLDRTTDATGLVEQRRLADVRAADAAHWFVPGRGAVRIGEHFPLRGIGAADVAGVDHDGLRVPTLGEVLEAVADAWVTMELKADGMHTRVLEILDAHSRAEDVIVGAFETHRLAALRSAAPAVATSASQGEVAAFWAWAHGYGHRPSLPYRALQVPVTHDGVEVVTPAFVDRAHDCGIAVHVWTVDEPSEARRLLDLGVDAIMTDRPGLLADVLGARPRG